MKQLNKDIKRLFTFCLLSSFLFVIGIPLIPVFAGKSWIIMTLGIVFVVFGFYGMPILWVNFASLKGLKRVVEAVEEENLYTNTEIAMHLQINERQVYENIKKAINKKYLVGYKYDGKTLNVNENKEKKVVLHKKVCKNCGGKLEKVGDSWHCPYCGVEFSFEQIE